MIVCAECGFEPRMRYPGGDPENGPAARRCRCDSAQMDPMWRGEPVDESGWPVHPDGCSCSACEYDRILEERDRIECQRRTGGKHEFYYTRDGDGESGPMPGGDIVCKWCGKEME